MSDAYQSSCRKDLPYPIVSSESAPSLLTNLTYALYGVINKSVVDGKIVWNIPCDPNNSTSVFGLPREEGEGLLCYILRLFASYPTPFNTVDLNSVQTLTNKTLTAPIITTPSISSPSFTGTIGLPANCITQAMIQNSVVSPAKLTTGAPNWDINNNLSVVGGLSVSGDFTASGVVNIPDSSISGSKIGDNSIVPAKLTTGAPSWNSAGDLTISGTIPTGRISNLIVSGTAVFPSAAISNSATSATSTNTANAIVSRDSSGNFAAGRMTATMVGATNGLEAIAGDVGEVIANSASGVSTANNSVTSICSITLTPGDWDVYGTIAFVGTGVSLSGSAGLDGGISTQSSAFDSVTTYFQQYHTVNNTTLTITNSVPTRRFNVSASTTLYLLADAQFSSGTMTLSGTITARRQR